MSDDEVRRLRERVAELEAALSRARAFQIAKRADGLPPGLEDCFECGFVDRRTSPPEQHSDDCYVSVIDAALATLIPSEKERG